MGQILRLGASEGADAPRHHGEPGGTRALVLGGGGINGAAFQVGALLALESILTGWKLTDFDLMVGTSAGAFLCACLANGVGPEDFAPTQPGPSAEAPVIAAHEILKPLRSRGGAAVWGAALARTVGRVARSRGQMSFIDAFFSVTEEVGAWHPYTTEGMESYLRRLFSGEGRTDSFDELPRTLLLPAVDLDTGERVVFGTKGAPQAPISRAVAASAAIPIVYEPVRVDGRQYVDGGVSSATHLDIALAHGASFVVLINPLVPFNHDPRYRVRGLRAPVRHLSEAGPGRLMSQVFRVIATSQVDRELELARSSHPGTDILVVEPRRDDESLFIENLMDYSARERLSRRAFEQVAVDLVTHFPAVEQLFRANGVEVFNKELVEQLREVTAGGGAGELFGRRRGGPSAS